MTRWTDFVKDYSDKHNIPYGCALSKASDAYHKKYGTTPKPKSPEKFKTMIQKANTATDNLEKKIGETKTAEKREQYATRYLDSNVKEPEKEPVKKKLKPDKTLEEARDFFFNYKPLRYTKKYKQDFNRYGEMLREPLRKEQDELYEKIIDDRYFEGIRDDKDARQQFDRIVWKATPYNAEKNIWNINKGDYMNIRREQVKLPPSFKRYFELQEELGKISGHYNV